MRQFIIHFGAQFQFVQVGFAEIIGPPEAGVLNIQLIVLGGSKGDCFAFARIETIGLTQTNGTHFTFNDAGNLFITVVNQLGTDGERSLVQGLGVDFGLNKGVVNRDGTVEVKMNAAPDSHILVGWSGIPIDETDSKVSGFGRKHFNGQDIFSFVQVRGNIKIKEPERTPDSLGIRNLFAVEPDIGIVIDSVKAEPGGVECRGIGKIELFTVPP